MVNKDQNPNELAAIFRINRAGKSLGFLNKNIRFLGSLGFNLQMPDTIITSPTTANELSAKRVLVRRRKKKEEKFINHNNAIYTS